MPTAYEAMIFAREVHKNQRRRYTGEPYIAHLAEVAGIVASVCAVPGAIETAWLHDCMEDQGVRLDQLIALFGESIAMDVHMLSDFEAGNRFHRKEASRARLAQATPWVQTIKVADLISNTASIVQHDPHFAKVYLEEKRLLLDALTKADERLVALARSLTTLPAAE